MKDNLQLGSLGKILMKTRVTKWLLKAKKRETRRGDDCHLGDK